MLVMLFPQKQNEQSPLGMNEDELQNLQEELFCSH